MIDYINKFIKFYKTNMVINCFRYIVIVSNSIILIGA